MARTTTISKSPRLSALYAECLSDGPLWDLCCDHGLLGQHAFLQDRPVFFVDVAPHLIELLQKKFSSPRVPVRKYAPEFFACDVRDLRGPIEGSVIIAGIGGYLMMELIDALIPKLRSPWRLILCANKNNQELQKYLLQQNEILHIVKKNSIIERERVREIVVVEGRKQ